MGQCPCRAPPCCPMGQCASGHAKPATQKERGMQTAVVPTGPVSERHPRLQKERVEDHQKEEEQEEAEKLQL